MPAKLKTTWIAVMDGNQARFFVLRRSEEGQIFEETAKPLVAQHMSRSEKPGRGRSSTAGRRHAAEPRLDPQKRDAMELTRKVAATLETALAKKSFEQLVLVAPSRNLSDLRDQLSVRAIATLAHQVPKNLTGLPPDALWDKLAAILLKAARPVVSSAAPQPSESGALPVSVSFRNMAASQSAEAEVARHAAKLGKKFGRLLSCKVTVEAPKHEHRKVKAFKVSVAMNLAGRTARMGTEETHVDLATAMREAFAAAMRQLDGQVRKAKDSVLRERRRSSPRLRGFAEA